jgi:4-carboxymuconolactone decarboxylase
MNSNQQIPSDLKERLHEVASAHPEVLTTLFQMNQDNQANSGLDSQTYHLVRLAALASADAPPASWLVNLSRSSAEQVSSEQLMGMFVAIAPLIGTARIVSAAGNILRAFGLAYLLEETINQPHASPI